MTICPYCNSAIAEGTRICPYCRMSLMPANAPQPMPHHRRNNDGDDTNTVVIGVMCFLITVLVVSLLILLFDRPQKPSRQTIVVERQVDARPKQTPARQAATPAPARSKTASASRRSSDKHTFSFSGSLSKNGNTYPIVMDLTLLPDGTVSGRYAYNKTLKRNGRFRPDSWFDLTGTYFRTSGGYNITMYSRLKGHREYFEQIQVWLEDGNRSLVGTLENLNTHDPYDVYLSR